MTGSGQRQQVPARALRQPVERQRPAHEVAHQALRLISPARRHRDIRMETEALEPGCAPPRGGYGDRRPEPAQRLPNARTDGRAGLERGRNRLREQRHACAANGSLPASSSGDWPRRARRCRTRRCTRVRSAAMSASVGGGSRQTEAGQLGSRAYRRRRRAVAPCC